MGYIARREPFGGVMAKTGSGEILLLEPFCYDVVKAIADGHSRKTIIEQADLAIPAHDRKEARRRIGELCDLVEGKIGFDDLNLPSPVNEFGFPALSTPLDLYWEITRRCNEQCLHCYNDSSPRGFNPALEDLKKIVEELNGHRLRSITLSGGEPMMRKDFWSIVGMVRPLCQDLVVGTNGTLITKDNMNDVAATIDTLNVSLDSPDEEDFDHFRGYRGAFRRTIAGLELLATIPSRVYIQTVLTKRSLPRLEALGRLVASLSPARWVVRFAFASGRATQNEEDFFTAAEAYAIRDQLNDIKQEFADSIPAIELGTNYPWSFEQPYNAVANPDRLQTCAGATTHAALDAYGCLAPCPLFTGTDFKSPSVYESSLLKEWRNAQPFQSMRQVHLQDIEVCGSCALANGICGTGCRAKAYMGFGTIYRNDYYCNFGKVDTDFP